MRQSASMVFMIRHSRSEGRTSPAFVHIHKFQNLRILEKGATISFLKTPLAETKVSLYLLNQFSNKKTLF